MKMDGKASWLKTTNSVLGCALQKMKMGMKSRRETEIRGRIHFGQCFLGCFTEKKYHTSFKNITRNAKMQIISYSELQDTKVE